MARRPLRNAPVEAADQNTRARLLVAAKAEFVEHGLKAASIASICRRAALANGTFYVHFQTKDQLYSELLRTAALELGARLRIAHQADLDHRSRDRVEVAIILAFAEEREDLFKLLLDERSSYPLIHRAFFNALHEQRRAAIEAGIAAGAFRPQLDPTMAALADFGVTTEIVQWWLANKDKLDRKFVIDRLADMRARMLFPD
jgi:AcrR family transcriptional regulator